MNFKNREAISFNKNGRIGFAGWASDSNVRPIINAFVKWCDWMVEEIEYTNKKEKGATK